MKEVHRRRLLERGAPTTKRRRLLERGAPTTKRRRLLERGAPTTKKRRLLERGIPTKDEHNPTSKHGGINKTTESFIKDKLISEQLEII